MDFGVFPFLTFPKESCLITKRSLSSSDAQLYPSIPTCTKSALISQLGGDPSNVKHLVLYSCFLARECLKYFQLLDLFLFLLTQRLIHHPYSNFVRLLKRQQRVEVFSLWKFWLIFAILQWFGSQNFLPCK